jgi:hypothetical protein
MFLNLCFFLFYSLKIETHPHLLYYIKTWEQEQ